MTECPDQRNELLLLIRSRYPIILLRTLEEERAERLVRDVCEELIVPLFHWTIARGLVNTRSGEAIPQTETAAKALAAIERADIEAVYLLKDMVEPLRDPLIRRMMCDLAPRFTRHCGSLIVLSHGPMDWPAELERWVATLHLKLPDERQLAEIVKAAFQEIAKTTPVVAELTRGQFEQLARSLRGLTGYEAKLAINRVIMDDRKLSADDLPRLLAAKQEAVARKGLLEFIPPAEKLQDVGGLDRLKSWLEQRRGGFGEHGRNFGLKAPRGMLLLGVQGCGKSLACKAVGATWGLPILRMDPGRLYSKYVGESEQRFAAACELAAAMQPCILWIDELEKAFASAVSADADGGLSRRLFGSVLGWLQDHPDGIFVVATANDIAALPPELIRKGRFDEIFFVDLPTAREREQVFSIHLSRRERDPRQFDLAALAAASEGFSGAEIEQAVLAGLYAAYTAGRELETAGILAELRGTYPLSVTQAERIAALRQWAQGRCVPAGQGHGG